MPRFCRRSAGCLVRLSDSYGLWGRGLPRHVALCCVLLMMPCGVLPAADPLWRAESPRDEIRPQFEQSQSDGPKGSATLTIFADGKPGQFGRWTATFPVEGGRAYQFLTWRKTVDVTVPRRTAVVRLLWQNSGGQPVQRDQPSWASYRPGERPRAEPEYVHDGERRQDEWVEVTGQFTAPSSAAQVRVELEYRWEAAGRVSWTQPELTLIDAPPARRAVLAAVHYCPQAGRTPAEKREQFAPLIATAAEHHADLVVLPETLTYYGTGLSFADVAEPIPGPSTEYFGRLSQQHNLYIVAGLVERDGRLLYNVAVLMGPDGSVVGKYRKVTLPRGEIEAGLMPGHEYPVFDTRFGKVGLMVCYDGFFPEVARQLSINGAEVIAWPVWGCNPLLAQARACENHVWLVSSTYTDASANWMVTGIFDHAGKVVAQATDFGSVIVHEVDLAQPLYWQSLGDFRAQIPHHRPMDAAETHAVENILGD